VAYHCRYEAEILALAADRVYSVSACFLSIIGLIGTSYGVGVVQKVRTLSVLFTLNHVLLNSVTKLSK